MGSLIANVWDLLILLGLGLSLAGIILLIVCTVKRKNDSTAVIMTFLTGPLTQATGFIILSSDDPLIFAILFAWLSAVYFLGGMIFLIARSVAHKKKLPAVLVTFVLAPALLVIGGMIPLRNIISGINAMDRLMDKMSELNHEEIGDNNNSGENAQEEHYSRLVSCAENGNYLDGMKTYSSIRGYLDAEVYYCYCEAMYAYQIGAIGYAFQELSKNPDFLESRACLEKIADKIEFLNGRWLADAKIPHLRLVIRDGRVDMNLVEYNTPPDWTFDETTLSSLILSHFSTGEEFIGIGSYWGSTGASQNTPNIDYVINTFDDTTDIMVIAYQESRYGYHTFNGIYHKVYS